MTYDKELSDAQRDTLQQALLTLRSELTHDETQAKQRTKTVELDQAAVGRISRIDAIQQQKMAQAELRRIELRLRQVALALKGIEEDVYGDCRRCGEFIGLRRLTARPESPFCVPCATKLGA